MDRLLQVPHNELKAKLKAERPQVRIGAIREIRGGFCFDRWKLLTTGCTIMSTLHTLCAAPCSAFVSAYGFSPSPPPLRKLLPLPTTVLTASFTASAFVPGRISTCFKILPNLALDISA